MFGFNNKNVAPPGVSGIEDDPQGLTTSVAALDECRHQVAPKDLNLNHSHALREHFQEALKQLRAHREQGLLAALPFKATTEALRHSADKAIEASQRAELDASKARDEHEHASSTLKPYVRHQAHAKWMYYLRALLLLLGDVGGITVAAILLGAPVFIAFMQAVSAGAAAVTMGAIGTQIRYRQEAKARHKEPEELSDDEKRYPTLFQGSHDGEFIIGSLVKAALLGFCVLAVAVMALRTSTEGLMTGICFGAFALVIGISSAVNSYDCADEVEDVLHNYATKQTHKDKNAETKRKDEHIQQRAAAESQAKSTEEAWEASGQAAAHHTLSKLHRLFGANGIVFGHATEAGLKDDDLTHTHLAKGLYGADASMDTSDVKEAKDAAPAPPVDAATAEQEPIQEKPSSNGHKTRPVPPPEIVFGGNQ